MSRKSRLKKAVIDPVIEEAKKLPKRPGRTYTANMDNIIFEATFKKGSDKDEAGKYVPTHLREATSSVILSVGGLTKANPNYKDLKVGVDIIPAGLGKITILEMDEKGYIGSIKPHDIIAIV